MDITISVSEKTEQIIREKAKENGKNVADFAGILLEEKVEETFHQRPEKKKLSDLAGIFYGGDGNTAENAEEILMTEIDKTNGFGR